MTDKEVQRLMRAAAQRLTSTEILYQNGMYLDSIYLAGYAPECAIKALLLKSQPARDRTQFMEKHFRSAKGHNLEFLKALLARSGRSLPSACRAAFAESGELDDGFTIRSGHRRSKTDKGLPRFSDTDFELGRSG